MTLPILLSVPHAGLTVPPEAAPYCSLSEADIAYDGDEGAAEIYDLSDHVAEFITTDIARAIVDLNRADDDFRPDGIIKTLTCWNVPVYQQFPPSHIIDELLEKYYRPYHERLAAAASREEIVLSVDCHTMAAIGPPIAPDPGQRRPMVCLGDVNGTTVPSGWMDQLAECFRQEFDGEVTINRPFSGGYIARTHGKSTPWLQLELSRDPSLPASTKRERVLRALTRFCNEVENPTVSPVSRA